MKNREFKEMEAVVSICGDYCAWHEASVYVDYIFGYSKYPESFEDEFCERLGIKHEDINKINDETRDNIYREIIEESEYSDYCDYEIRKVICEFRENKIINTYMQIS
jgi:hypothetical protein